MFRPGPEWIVIILLVAIFIFGAKRLPEIGSSLGKGIRMFKSSVSGEDENPQNQSPQDPKRIPTSSDSDDLV